MEFKAQDTSAVTANVCPVCSDAAVAVDGSPEPV